jgi:putative ABC transport system permease protein
MLAYYIRLAVRSLKRNVVLTSLMIAAIAVGIGASMTTLTVFRAMSGDPIPRKASQLFVPQIDSWGPNKPGGQGTDDLNTQLDYVDAMALMKARKARRQSAMFLAVLSVRPADAGKKPFKSRVRAAYADFFPMFDVPFEYGSSWTAADDDNRAAVVVITREMNDRLFGGSNSVGKTIHLDSEVYSVVGVIEDWRPIPHFYDLNLASFGQIDEMFVPFSRAIDRHMSAIGNTMCKDDTPVGWEALLASDCLWLQFWVELPTPADVQQYRGFIDNYAAEQQRIGRFHWPMHTQLRDVMQWLAYRHVVPSEVNILLLVSFGFLLVCLLNAMGLMLAKIMGRAGDIGVRRALGASRAAIFTQCVVETGIVGFAGGILGLALTGLGLLASRSLLDEELIALTYLDWTDIAIAFFLAVGATIVAGLYPTWRAAHVEPAWQLKAQ